MPNIDPNVPNAKGKTMMDYIPEAMRILGIGKGTRPAEGEGGDPVMDVVTYGAGDPVIGKKEIELAYKEKTGCDTVRIRIDKITGNVPCVYRIQVMK